MKRVGSYSRDLDLKRKRGRPTASIEKTQAAGVKPDQEIPSNDCAKPLVPTQDLQEWLTKLEWKDGFALLPGTNKRVKLFSNGQIEIVEEKEEEETDSVTSNTVNSSNGAGAEVVVPSTPISIDNDIEAGEVTPKEVEPDEAEKVKEEKPFLDNTLTTRRGNSYKRALSEKKSIHTEKQEAFDETSSNSSLETASLLKQATSSIKRRSLMQSTSEHHQSDGSTNVNEDDTNGEIQDKTNAGSQNEGNPVGSLLLAQQQKAFCWRNYLDANNLVAAPKTLFKHITHGAAAWNSGSSFHGNSSTTTPKKGHHHRGNSSSRHSRFRVGHYLEGIDLVQHPSLFCVLKINEIQGTRLRLHFEGYSENYDFWLNADYSLRIFPAGWCARNGRLVSPPKMMAPSQSGHTSKPFTWQKFQKVKPGKLLTAPEQAFAVTRSMLPDHSMSSSAFSPISPRLRHPSGPPSVSDKRTFKRGHKLEAVDRDNQQLICVATVIDTYKDQILIHYDGWNDAYDFWTTSNSPYIRPCGWCADFGRVLTPPPNWAQSADKPFTWSDYLIQTKCEAAPKSVFHRRKPIAWRVGSCLEAVDFRNPRLIRVASIGEVKDFRIKIHFEGWPDDFDYWVDDNCPDIFPCGFCEQTGHPLQPPPDGSAGMCSVISQCRGLGHAKGSKFQTHSLPHACPYSQQNRANLGFNLPERLPTNLVFDVMLKIDQICNGGFSLMNSSSMLQSATDAIFPHSAKHKGKFGKMIGGANEGSSGISPDKLETELRKVFHKMIFNATIIQTPDPPLNQTTGPLTDATFPPRLPSLATLREWSPEVVSKFITGLTGSGEVGRKFLKEQIDGNSLILLRSCQELMSLLGLKFGQSLKIFECLKEIKSADEQTNLRVDDEPQYF